MLQVNIQLRKLKRPSKKVAIKKALQTIYMAKKTIYPGKRGIKNKVLKRHIDLTGINKVRIVG